MVVQAQAPPPDGGACGSCGGVPLRRSTGCCAQRGTALPDTTKLLVVGAGPHALALCARLREPLADRWAEWPGNSVLFREGKGGRCHHVQRNAAHEGQHAKRDIVKAMYLTKHAPLDAEDMVVVDPRGSFMARWQSAFDLLGIQHLRSTRFVHLDPADQDALTVASERFDGPALVSGDKQRDEGRGGFGHFMELKGLLRRKEFHGPYDAPSTALFHAHCEQIARRYRLEDSLARGTVVALRPPVGGGDGCIEVDVDVGEGGPEDDADEGSSRRVHTVRAERVVFAGGFAAAPRWPAWAAEAKEQAAQAGAPSCAITHAHDLFDAGRVATSALDAGETVCVIGGALTACHLALAARSRLGYARATLLARREMATRQFDLDDPWMSIGRNARLAAYWSEPDAEARLAAARSARKCATASPEVLARVRKEAAAGRLDAREGVEVWAATWEPALAQGGGNDGGGGGGGGRGSWRLELSDGTTLCCSRVWLATGSDADVRLDPVLGPLAAPGSLLPPAGGTHSGLPGLTPELRWASGTELYIMGAYATLQLGPDALNLAGARAGAARVAAALGWEPREAIHIAGARAGAARAGGGGGATIDMASAGEKPQGDDQTAACGEQRKKRFAPRARARSRAVAM